MVASPSLQSKASVAFVALLILLGLGVGLYYCFSILSHLISGPGAACLFGVCLVITIRTAVQLVVFPGSFNLWRRSIESLNCRMKTKQLGKYIVGARKTIEVLIEGRVQGVEATSLPRGQFAASKAKLVIDRLLMTCEELKEDGYLRKRQLELYGLVVELKAAMQAPKLVLQRSSEVTLWDWLGSSLQNTDVTFNDDLQHEAALAAIQRCKDLERFLMQSYRPVNLFSRAKRWLYDNTLGNIDQMRIELKVKYNGETFWATADDGKLIDCIWLRAEGSQSGDPAVLMCNGNSGFYEFANSQSDWLEFYLFNGVNICMWNYRGYGRSTGSPSLKQLQKDAVSVLKHLKDVRGCVRIGVHGESMGGAVACYLAAQCRLDFLFADRTFSSLAHTARFGFGRAAQMLLRLFAGKSPDSVADYLTASCPKFLSADPSDDIISDLASLKAGIAERISSSRKPALSETDLKDLATAYTRLMKLIIQREIDYSSFKGNESLEEPYRSGDSDRRLDEQLLRPSGTRSEDAAFMDLLLQVADVIGSVDAGGKTLKQLYRLHKRNEIQQGLRSWIYVADVWGSFYDFSLTESGRSRRIAVERLKKAAEDLSKLAEKSSSEGVKIDMCKDTAVLATSLMKIGSYIEIPLLKACDTSSSDANTQSRNESDMRHAGHLVPVTCGHSGPFNTPERLLFEALLESIGFFSQ